MMSNGLPNACGLCGCAVHLGDAIEEEQRVIPLPSGDLVVHYYVVHSRCKARASRKDPAKRKDLQEAQIAGNTPR